MNIKVEEYITYVKTVKQHTENTCAAYEQDLNRFHMFLEEICVDSYDKVNETLLNSYIISLEKQNFSPSTISRNIVVIRNYFLYLMNERLIDYNPTAKIHGPKLTRQMPQMMSVEEMSRLMNSPDTNTRIGMRDKAMFELLYGTGIKASEIIALTTTDVNYNYNIVTCRGSKKDRLIPFGRQAKEALEQYMEHARDSFMTKGDSEILFLSQQGHALTRQGFWKIVKGYGKKIGLNDISPQILRHSFAMHLIENGANVSTVGEMLGYVDSSQAYAYVAAQNTRVRDEYMKAHPRAK